MISAMILTFELWTFHFWAVTFQKRRRVEYIFQNSLFVTEEQELVIYKWSDFREIKDMLHPNIWASSWFDWLLNRFLNERRLIFLIPRPYTGIDTWVVSCRKFRSTWGYPGFIGWVHLFFSFMCCSPEFSSSFDFLFPRILPWYLLIFKFKCNF